MCVCMQYWGTYTHTHTYIYQCGMSSGCIHHAQLHHACTHMYVCMCVMLYIYIYIYICVCVCVLLQPPVNGYFICCAAVWCVDAV